MTNCQISITTHTDNNRSLSPQRRASTFWNALKSIDIECIRVNRIPTRWRFIKVPRNHHNHRISECFRLFIAFTFYTPETVPGNIVTRLCLPFLRCRTYISFPLFQNISNICAVCVCVCALYDDNTSSSINVNNKSLCEMDVHEMRIKSTAKRQN